MWPQRLLMEQSFSILKQIKTLHFIDWTQALIAIENTITVSTDYEIFFAGW